jgi:polysaccharide export outer membrane protein
VSSRTWFRSAYRACSAQQSRWNVVAGLVAVALCGAGCARAVVRRALPSPVEEHTIERLDSKALERVPPETLKAMHEPLEEGQAYRVGPGDTVLVAVYGHPELSMAPYTGATSTVSNGRLAGLVIDNDGTIQFPLVGSVKVAGKSVEQMRVFLEHELTRYVKDPKVTVQVIFSGSIRYYLLGQFAAPGMKYSDRPLRLLEAMSLGGSVMLDKASLRGAYVARNNKRLPVNFRRLVHDGDLRENIALKTGDIVFIPDIHAEQAFVFGAAATSNPTGGPVPFRNGHLDIVQALAASGFGFRDRAQGRLAKTRVIRSEGDTGEYFVVNVSKILSGKAAPFALAPGDVVYVPPTAFTTFNQALEQLLPTLQTVAGVLQPFVQIKFLETAYGAN